LLKIYWFLFLEDLLMFEKIVVLLDGSPLAERVLPHTYALAQTFPNAAVTLLQVLEPVEKTAAGRLDPVDWHLRKIEAQTSLNAVSQQWSRGVINPETEILEGMAANRIIEYIENNQPDLIMLSSHGQGGPSPWNVSSVAQKVIYRACKSFMLVRTYEDSLESTAEIHYRRILVPLDGSKRAECVLPYVTRLADENEAEIILIHALESPTVLHEHMLTPEVRNAVEQIKNHNQLEAERYLAQVASQIPSKVTTRIVSGSNAVSALLKSVRDNDIDLIIMGAHGDTGETMRPHGSVVSSFISYGSTPLLLIQDLPRDQIKPIQAELSATNKESTARLNRTTAYAQPAIWSRR
jgi:nucleotide-binding universal stress UspA family protein